MTLRVRLRPASSRAFSSSVIKVSIRLCVPRGTFYKKFPSMPLGSKAEVFKHPHVIFRGSARGGKVVAYHHAVGPGGEDQGLEVTEGHPSAAAYDYLFGGHHEPYERDYPEALDGGEVIG